MTTRSRRGKRAQVRALPASPLLEGLKGIVDGLRAAIGPDCEVVLHDLRSSDRTIIAIAGAVTNREIGGPPTDLLLRLMHEGETEAHAVNYETRTQDGKVLRSSTLFLKDETGTVIGSLCINVDITYIRHFRTWVSSFCAVGRDSPNAASSTEHFARDVREVLEDAISDALDVVGVPAAALRKADRIRVVGVLASKGIFSIRGSAMQVAERLGVSRASIYNYLEGMST